MGFDDMRPRARVYDSWGLIGIRHGQAEQRPEQPAPYKLGDYCPSCASPEPHRHPATSFEGEVSLCLDDFHLIPTAQNRPGYIDAVRKARAERDAPAAGERAMAGRAGDAG